MRKTTHVKQAQDAPWRENSSVKGTQDSTRHLLTRWPSYLSANTIYSRQNSILCVTPDNMNLNRTSTCSDGAVKEQIPVCRLNFHLPFGVLSSKVSTFNDSKKPSALPRLHIRARRNRVITCIGGQKGGLCHRIRCCVEVQHVNEWRDAEI